MKIKLSAHSAYHHQYHVVWIPKYRKKILKGELKQYLEKGLFDIQTVHPDIEPYRTYKATFLASAAPQHPQYPRR